MKRSGKGEAFCFASVNGDCKKSAGTGQRIGAFDKRGGAGNSGAFAKPLTDLGAIATPLAIICVGATLSFDALKRYKNYLIWATLGRLVIVPGVFLGVSLVLGLRGIELAGLFLIYATPVASSSYPMARELDGNGELAGVGVAVSNVACLFTLFLWITLLKFFGLC